MFISGATGDYAIWLNGFFDPTQEKGLDGHVLYTKRGDARVCIEHFEGLWRVKPLSSKDGFYACVEGGCGLEACTSRVWKAWDGEAWNDVPMKLVLEAEVRRCCACSRSSSSQLTPARAPLLTSPIADSRRQGKGCC